MRHDDKFYDLRTSQTSHPARAMALRRRLSRKQPFRLLGDATVTQARVSPRRTIDLADYETTTESSPIG